MAKSVALFEEKQKQEGVFRSLWSGLRELVWPNKLPPLVLESRPVAVVDRMARRGAIARQGGQWGRMFSRFC